MITSLWDTAYEATPTNLLDKSLIPDDIHLMKVNIEQRLGGEHLIGPWATLIVASGESPDHSLDDSGKHWPGHTTVADYDTISGSINGTPRPTTNIHIGALFVEAHQQDGLTKGQILELWDGVNWVTASTNIHVAVGNTDVDDHPQYVLNNGSMIRNVLTGPLDAGGNFLYVTNVNGAAMGNLWVNETHVAAVNPHSLDNGGAYDDDAYAIIPVDPSEPSGDNCKLDINRSGTSGSIIPLVDTGHVTGLTNGSSASIALSPRGFMPSVRVYCPSNQGAAPAGDVPYAPPSNGTFLKASMLVHLSINGGNLVIRNYTGQTIEYRVVQFGFSTGAI